MIFNVFAIYGLIGTLREIISHRDDYILDIIRKVLYKHCDMENETYYIKASDIRAAIEDLSAIDLLVLRNILISAKEGMLLQPKTPEQKYDESIFLYTALVGAIHEQILPF